MHIVYFILLHLLCLVAFVVTAGGLFRRWRPKGFGRVLLGITVLLFPWSTGVSASFAEGVLLMTGSREWNDIAVRDNFGTFGMAWPVVPIGPMSLLVSLIIGTSCFYLVRSGLRRMCVASAIGMQKTEPKCPNKACRYILPEGEGGKCSECGCAYRIDRVWIVDADEPAASK